MSQLHLIQSPINFRAFKKRYALCVEKNDSILFLNDSLFSLTLNEFHSGEFTELLTNTSYLYLNEQVEARAICKLIHKAIKPIDYPEFIKLSQESSKIVSW